MISIPTHGDRSSDQGSQSTQFYSFSQRTESTQAFSQQNGVNLANFSLSELILAPSPETQTGKEDEAKLELELTRLLVMPTASGTRLAVVPLTPTKEWVSYCPTERTSRSTGMAWLKLPVSLSDNAPVHVLAVSQTDQAPGCIIEATLPPGGQDREMHYKVLFDPSRDDVFFANVSRTRAIHVIPAEDTNSETEDGKSPKSFTVNAGGFQYIPSGTYRLQLAAEDGTRELVHLKVMPRRFFDPSFGPLEPPTHLDQDESPGLRTRKRSKLSDESQVSQLLPTKRAQGSKGVRHAHAITNVGGQIDPICCINPLVAADQGHSIILRGLGKANAYSLRCEAHIVRNRSTEVFTATHSGLLDSPGRVVIVKVLKSKANNEWQYGSPDLRSAVNVWLEETRIHSLLTKSLSQRPDVSVVSMLASDARLLTMYQEHVPGSSLGSWPGWLETKTHRFRGTVEDARRVLCDMANAVDHVHSLGILHNDIKPSNIIYSHDRAVLVDFGLASMRNDVKSRTRVFTSSCMHAGTPWYLPPEYVTYETRQEPSDIFALGVVMLFVLGLMQLPDILKKHEQWPIAHVHGPARRICNVQEQKIARRAMYSWLGEVDDLCGEVAQMVLRDDLGEHKQLYATVVEMLQPEVNVRITAPDLLQRVRNWEGHTLARIQ